MKHSAPMPLAAVAALATACAAALLSLLPAPASAEGGPQRRASWAPMEDASGARVIVKYKALGTLMRAQSAAVLPAPGPQHASTLAERSHLSLRDGRIIDRRTQVVRGDSTLTSAALAARLAADADVEYAVPDLRRRALAMPNDQYFLTSPQLAAGQWYLRAPDATFISAINAAGAWDITTGSSGSSGIVVADVDTGVLFSHPDLANKLYAGYDFITDLATANDGGGRDADATDPGDATAANECDAGDPKENSSWHGTQTASLIGAETNNTIGMASVGYNVMVLPIRALGKCGGYDSDIAAGMLWAAGLTTVANPTPGLPAISNPHPARVINLSLGSTGACSAAYVDVVNQLTAANVVVVASAGNSGIAVGTPANCPGVIAVGGLRHAGTKVGYSSLGTQVAVSAPAGNCVNGTGACLYPILTATNTGTTTAATNTYSDSFNYSVGTSFSAPLVSGTVALMLSVNPTLKPAQVKALLQSSARAFPAASGTTAMCTAPTATAQDECACTTSTCGAGMLDASAAVTAAAVGSATTAAATASATTVTAGSTVTFDGTTSTPSNGHTIVSYQWAITSSTVTATFSSGTTSATASVVTPAISASGSYTVRLTVTDNVGASASKSVTVNVNAAAAPTVNVLSSATVVSAGSSVTLDGSGTTAASGLSIVAYQWSIVSGGTLATITSSATAPTVTVATAAGGSGSFTVQLTATDNAGRSSSTTQVVSVTASGPTASISTPSLSVTPGSSVVFNGAGSIAPTGRTIASYRWTITSGSSIATLSSGATAASATVLISGAGSFTVQLAVTDSAGVLATNTSTVTVAAATVATTTSTGSSSGGGGGALGASWLLLLLTAVLALAAEARYGRRLSARRPGSRKG